MELKYPFEQYVRDLFYEVRFSCFLCGANECELHHIRGRVSDSPFNGAVLCKECHAGVNHGDVEESFLLAITADYIVAHIEQGNYTLRDRDQAFVSECIRYSRYTINTLSTLSTVGLDTRER